MKSRRFTFLLLAPLAVACSGESTSGTRAAEKAPPPVTERPAELPAESQTTKDLELAQRVRQALMDDGTYASGAKVLGITAENGVITLRGTVETLEEKDHIATVARGVMGVVSVENLLEVKPS